VLADGKPRRAHLRRRFGQYAAGYALVLWFWSVTEIVLAVPNVTNGTAATREEAMAKFRAAWENANDLS
jgi:hypothetical protein